MSADDDLTQQTTEVQDALRHVLQESGAAGTGPLRLPPPADITSTQQRSASSADPDTYSNTLKLDLYRDAAGKVWTQPGPGHDAADIHMRVRKMKDQWHVVMEHQHGTGRHRRGRQVFVESETDAMTASGAPVTELGSFERFEQFSPQSVKEAMRQAIAGLQQRGAIYVYDPNAPVPGRTAGLVSKGILSNGLVAAAVLAAAGALAAFVGAGPFAAAANGVSVAPIDAATAPPTAVPSAVASFPLAKVTGSGTISLALSARYGSQVGTAEYSCFGNLTPYVSDGAGGFTRGPAEPAMTAMGRLQRFNSSGQPTFAQTFTVFFSAQHTLLFSNDTSQPGLQGGPAPSYVPGQHAAGTVGLQAPGTSAASDPLFSGSVTVDLTCTGGSAGVGAAPAPLAVSAPPAGSPVPSSNVLSSSPIPSGPSPWGAGLGVVAVGAAAAAFVTRTRSGTGAPLAPGGVVVSSDPPETPKTGATDCSALEEALRQLHASLADLERLLPEDTRAANFGTSRDDLDDWVRGARRTISQDRINIARVEEALARCRAGAGADVVPTLRQDGVDPDPAKRGLASVGEELRRRPETADETRERTRGSGGEPRFDPKPPSDGTAPEDPTDRTPIE